MILYLFKLILILVFNTVVNTYYINSGCKCCCCKSKQADTGNGGSTNNPIVIEFVDNSKINIDSKNLELSSENIPGGIVDASFTDCITFCELDKSTYNSFTTNRKITFKKTPAENKFVLFAVKTTSGGYYLGCCNNGNSVEDNGLFSGSMLNQEIKILGNGCDLNDINHMFSYNTNLGNIVFTNCFDTNNVTDMSYMFYSCSSLKELNLNNFNTNNVTNMSNMFCYCKILTKLNVSNFNTSKVKNMAYMFNGCSSVKKLNLSNFETSNVTNMNSMFCECSAVKEINLFSFNTSNVIDMCYMFFGCSSLKELNLSSFNTDNVTNMKYMFYCCSSLEELNLSNFNTNNVTNMSNMFSVCTALEEKNLIYKDKKLVDAFKA